MKTKIRRLDGVIGKEYAQSQNRIRLGRAQSPQTAQPDHSVPKTGTAEPICLSFGLLMTASAAAALLRRSRKYR